MYKCKECKKKTTILAEGMCVSCYEKSPLYNMDSTESVFAKQEELEDELSDLMSNGEKFGVDPIEDKKNLLRSMANTYKQLNLMHAMAAIGVVVVAGGGYLYYDYTQTQSFKATVINGEVVEISDDPEMTTCSADEKYCDRDGDKIPDQKELSKTHTNPFNSDTDDDGLNDYEEIVQYGTNPNLQDTDGDGISDGDEVIAGTNPHNSNNN